MYYQTDVGLIHAHAERRCTDNDDVLFRSESLPNALLFSVGECCVEGFGVESFTLEPLRDLASLGNGSAVDNNATVFSVLL